MSFYRIAVVTKNREIGDFFKLELKLFHIDVEIFDSLEELIDSYLFVVVDTDTCDMSDGSRYTLIPLSSGYDTDISWGNCRLGWPLLLADIQNLCGIILTDEESHNMRSAWDNNDMFIFLNPDKNEAVLHGNRIQLSKNEFSILRVLCENSGKTVIREDIMKLLGASEGNISDVYICHLRRKLESGCKQRFIFTERGKGYYTILRKE